MAKRPRCLLGLGALFAYQTTLVKGFVLPSSVRVQQKSHEKLCLLRQHDKNSASTCLLFARNADNRKDAASEAFNSNSQNSFVENMSLSELLEALDKQNVRYPPSATRYELEQLLLLQSNTREETDAFSSSGSSLQELIQELDRRNVRYPPTASRKELEALLFVDSSPSDMQSKERTANVDDAQTRKTTMKSPGEMTLTELLQELDRQSIRYPPTASRMQLEALLLRAGEAGTNQRPSDTLDKVVTVETVSPKSDNTKQSVVQEREAAARTRAREGPRTGGALVSSSSGRRMPLTTLLAELDSLNIRYSPTASRVELEDLLAQASEQQALHEERRQQRRLERQAREEGNGSIKDLLKKSTRVARKSVQKFPRKVSRIATSPQVTSRISGVAESAARQAKRVSRQASDFWNTDEDGIRDVKFEYVSVDRPIDVRAVRLDEDGDDSQRRVRRPRRPSPRTTPPPPRTRMPRTPASGGTADGWQYNGRIPKQQRSRPTRPPGATWQANNRVPRQQWKRRPVSRRRQEASLGSSSFLLPPASLNAIPFPDSKNVTSTTKSQTAGDNDAFERRRQTRNGNVKKQIYSPRTKYVYDEEGEIEGPFDQIGDFLTNSVDRLLWGSDGDDDSGTDDNTQEQKDKTRSRHERKHNQRKSVKEEKPRYWKDRLAEQVDYALGIHEDGEYYNSWEKQLDEEQRRIDRDGPEFWETKSRKRRRPVKGRVKNKGPIWEEDGSLLSLILGRTKRGGQLKVERLMDRARGDNRMVTTFFNSALQSILLVSTYVCRWASVRGTVPQPIVVIGVISSFLSARPGYRLRTVLVALLALRTAGELIHGYAYGDEDWEADDIVEDEEHPATGES